MGFDENVRRTGIIRASSGASALLMMVMQSCFHDAARTTGCARVKPVLVIFVSERQAGIDKISRINQP
jgi:hypothetical protein